MNKFQAWFYEKDKAKILREVEEHGLKIMDEDKFYEYIKKVSKKNMINSFILAGIIILIILKWIGIIGG